ncbi:MFS transporter [Streptomyces sp. RS10V-4]|uniref:MFS transporter n=1 Tax=Streptomyces rhizoryzae TaxID=2932493 RepID=UPI0020064942|nr:MFS transporter [Streptomyces rhizoryzae]MCK7628229.1 MFS transporter [Streptomyces rhizoryzae]
MTPSVPGDRGTGAPAGAPCGAPSGAHPAPRRPARPHPTPQQAARQGQFAPDSAVPAPAPATTPAAPAPVTVPGPASGLDPGLDPAPDPRRWLVLAVASAAQFLAVLDLIAVTIAFPAIGEDFAPAPASALSWVLNGYTVVLAALLIPAGRLADEAGRRRCFLAGMALFGLASAVCGLVPTLPLLIAARVVQGAAAAVLIPTSLSLALPAFPARERATAVGVWTAVSAVAASSGPVIGGLLAASDWRLIFLINVPVVLLAVGAGVRLLPRSVRGPRQALDLPGTVLVLVCVGALVTAFAQAPEWGYTAPGTLAVLAAGALAGVLGVRHVRRAARPVVDPALFRAPGFTAAASGLLGYFVAYGVMMLAASLLFTDVWHYSVRTAGLALAPWPLTVLVVSAVSGRIVAVLGGRGTAVAGALCFVTAALWWLALAGDGGAGAGYAVRFLPGLIFAGFGAGLYQPVMFAAAGALPASRLSLGSGVLMVSRQAGTALGVAVLVAVMGGQQHPGLGALRGGWVIAAVASMGAVAAALALGRDSGRAAAGGRRAARGAQQAVHEDGAA